MTGDISKFIKFFNDLQRGCHVEDSYDEYVYCLINGSLRYVISSRYRDRYFDTFNACCWSLDSSGIDYVMKCINSHSLRIVYDPNYQPKEQRQVRKVEL